jgi:restriction system protein
MQIAAQRKLELERRRTLRQAASNYVAARESEAQDETLDAQNRIEALNTILRSGLKRDPRVDFAKLKIRPTLPTFDSHRMDVREPEPSLEDFMPPPLPLLARLLPPLVNQYAAKVDAAHVAMADALAAHSARESKRIAELERLIAEYRAACERIERAAVEHNDEIDGFKASYEAHERDALIDYFELVIEGDLLPYVLPSTFRIAYVAESKQLVIERQLPTIDLVPQEAGFRYIRKGDRIEATKRKPSDLRASYADLLAQLVLRILSLVVRADVADAVAVVALNGYVDTIDPATGNRVRPMLISLSTAKGTLETLAFDRVDPVACLRSLKALVSRSAHELEPVRPIVNFDMVDRRFIDKTDVLSDLDSRPNLAELSPAEFEVLMTNLFEKMGLETRLTQASRDGGVDCVAWDMRPVIGGKVIVQAKRYKNTVGVSAVRDLYGTMLNEGAAKGILVTTSGYGQSAYEFAKNKPIELITGSNLLSMLSEYASIEAKIAFPDDWKDIVPVG